MLKFSTSAPILPIPSYVYILLNLLRGIKNISKEQRVE
jgi:hypothetical protein